MKSPGRSLARLVNRAPVPYVAKRQNFAQAFAAPTPMVQEMTAMGQVGTLFAIVTKCANATSQVEWKLWRKAKSGKKEDRVEVTTHLALQIWNKPNTFFPKQEFVETFQQHHELTGEFWWVIGRSPLSNLPLELWPVRPDKMQPVPDADEFTVGYIYTGPNGEQVPLKLDQVIFGRSPNPLDPYRGMGPVQTILPDLNASNMAAQYVANFFTNSAEPGGIIEVEKRLSDDEFDEMTTRWREQHQGVSNAHRVAVLEQGKWVDRKYSMKDMQFTELRTASSEMIREAFGFPKPLLGTVDDVNRANADAAEYVFAKWLIVPRLERIRGALNNDFLPLFYPKGAVPDVEFDYESPVPEDKEFESSDRKSKADVVSIYVGLGFDEAEVLEMLDLPALTFTKPEPPPAPVPPAIEPGPDDDPVPPPPGAASNRAPTRHKHWPTNAAALDPDDEPDLTPVQESWEKALAELLEQWGPLVAAQISELIGQIEDIVSSGTVMDLLRLEATSDAAAAAILAALVVVGGEAAALVVEEAAAQDVSITPVPPRTDTLTPLAVTVAAMLAAGVAFSAVREALRIWHPAATAADVGRLVREQLQTLTAAQPRAWLGSALTQAQRQGRMNTLLAAPTAAWYASEQLDKNTCLDPRTLVTTDRGQVEAQDVKQGDLLLTHAGRWVLPSHRVVTDVSEQLVTLRLVDGSGLKLTADHPVLLANNEWRQAGQLAVGDLVISQATLQSGAEIVPPDLFLGQSPDGVAPADQIRGLPRIDVWAEAVPVRAVCFDDQRADHEVDGPAPGASLRPDVQPQRFEDQADGALDTGFDVAGHVAMHRAEPASAHRAGDDPELRTTVSAVEQGRRSATYLGAVVTGGLLTVPEGCTAPLADSVPPASVHGAGARTVVVADSVRHRHAERNTALGADLSDRVTADDLGHHRGIGVLAGDRAVDGSCLASGSDLLLTDLAEPGRVDSSPACACSTGPAANGAVLADDRATAVNTHGVHLLSVLEIVAVGRDHYAGPVYDFTVPGDHTFWAGGVLVHNCGPCRKVDGKWLGNSIIDNVNRMYPTGGYIDCEGRDRCRGMVVGVWRPKQVGDE